MNFFAKPLAFIGRHPWWTLFLLCVFFLLPTFALIVAGALEVFRGFASKLLGDAGAKLADWLEEILTKSLWLVGLVLFFIPPLWPLALALTAWQAVDYASNKGGARADFSASFSRAAAAGGKTSAGVGEDVYNAEDPMFDY